MTAVAKKWIVLCGVGIVLGASPVAGEVWEVDNLVLTAPEPQTGANFGTAIALGDFDNDGDLDLVVGAPFEDWSGPSGNVVDAGGVYIFQNNGQRQLGFWESFHGTEGSFMGMEIATGDFDGDNLDEVAAGSPFMDYLATEGGLVWIWGYPWSGFPIAVEQCSGLDSGTEVSDRYGSVLAVGDFDDDGIDDLAVGIPDEGYGGSGSAGKVCVRYKPLAAGAWSQELIVDPASLDGTITTHDELGAALAAGDFDGNGVDDLAMGASGRDVGGNNNAGQVHIVHGLSGGGLTLVGQAVLSYASFGQAADVHDRFGASLAAGDFDDSDSWCVLHGPCYDDLAIGVPGDDQMGLPPIEEAGKVVVSYGSSTGLDLTGTTLLSQSGLSESPEALDRFGSTLAAGRLRGRLGTDGLIQLARTPYDLVIGVPEEDSATEVNSGYIHLAFGSSSGVAQGDPAEQPLPLRSGYGAAPPAASDNWGRVLAVGDLDGDGYGDLVVGLGHKTVDGKILAGVVQVLFGGLFADGFGIGDTSGW